jgi:hypothetical protein
VLGPGSSYRKLGVPRRGGVPQRRRGASAIAAPATAPSSATGKWSPSEAATPRSRRRCTWPSSPAR